MTANKTKKNEDAIAKSTPKDSAEEPSLGELISDLDRQVEWFYSDNFRLEEAVDRYKDAAKLAKKIEADLKSLRNEIEVLTEDFS